MDNIFNNLKLSCVLVNIDDIICFENTFTNHLSYLEQIFMRLKENNIKLSQYLEAILIHGYAPNDLKGIRETYLKLPAISSSIKSSDPARHLIISGYSRMVGSTGQHRRIDRGRF